jgi:hypothetical protein
MFFTQKTLAANQRRTKMIRSFLCRPQARVPVFTTAFAAQAATRSFSAAAKARAAPNSDESPKGEKTDNKAEDEIPPPPQTAASSAKRMLISFGIMAVSALPLMLYRRRQEEARERMIEDLEREADRVLDEMIALQRLEAARKKNA